MCRGMIVFLLPRCVGKGISRSTVGRHGHERYGALWAPWHTGHARSEVSRVMEYSGSCTTGALEATGRTGVHGGRTRGAGDLGTLGHQGIRSARVSWAPGTQVREAPSTMHARSDREASGTAWDTEHWAHSCTLGAPGAQAVPVTTRHAGEHWASGTQEVKLQC